MKMTTIIINLIEEMALTNGTAESKGHLQVKSPNFGRSYNLA